MDGYIAPEQLGFWMNYGGLIVGLSVKVVIAMFGLCISYFALIFIQSRDKRLVEIREKWDGTAQAIYRGLTIVGICILMGFILSAPI